VLGGLMLLVVAYLVAAELLKHWLAALILDPKRRLQSGEGRPRATIASPQWPKPAPAQAPPHDHDGI
jgi:hypothetical protein